MPQREALAQKIDTLISGQYTQPYVWPGSPGCIHHWTAGNTSAGLADHGIGNIPSYQVHNYGNLSAFVYILADTIYSLPARAYIPSQLNNRVAIVDLANNTVLKSVDVGRKPYGVAISHNGTRIYVSNYTDGTVSVIDGIDDKVITTITVGKNPTAVAVSPNDNAIYVANSGDGTVSIIDATNNVATGALTTGANPMELATSKDGSLLYVGYGSTNTLDVFKLQAHSLIATSISPAAVRGMVLSGDGNTLYTLNPGAGQVYNTINTVTNTSVAHNVGAGVNGIALTPDGGTLYLTSGATNQVSSINTSNHALNKQITVGNSPNGVAVAPGGLVYVINQDSNDISVIDATAGTVVNTFKTGDLQLFAHGNFIRGSTCDAADAANSIDTLSTGPHFPGPFFYVMPSPPTILTKGTPNNLTTYADEASGSTFFIAYARSLTEGITITAPSGYQVSSDNIHFDKTIIIGAIAPGYVDNVIETPVYVRLAEGNTVGTNNGIIKLTSEGASPVNIAINGNIIEPIANIKTGPLNGTIAFCGGSPSAYPHISQFKVNGSLLTGPITLTAPANFEISTSQVDGYTTQVILPSTGGKVSNITLFVRSSAGALGDIVGDIKLSSAGANDRFVTVKGTVFPVPMVSAVNNLTVKGGLATPAINFTGSGNNYDWVSSSNPSIGLSASGSGNIASFKAINNGTTNVVATITVTPTNAPLAFVPNQGNSSVSIINTVTNKILGNIPVDRNPYAVTVTPDGTRAFVASQGNGGTIAVINTATGTVINTLPSGINPSGLAVTPDGGLLFITNGTGGTVTVINLNNGLTFPLIHVGAKPLGIAINGDGSLAYVTNQDDNSVSVINIATLQVTAIIKVGVFPQSVAITPDGNWVYVANYTNKNISIINTATNTVTGTIALKYSPSFVTVTPDGHTLYVTYGGVNSISAINLANNTVTGTVLTDTSPEGLSVSPDGKLVYVANFGGNDITIYSTATNQQVGQIGLPGPPVAFGNFIVAGTGCAGIPTTFTITVEPGAPHILPDGALTALSTIYGKPSASASIKVSAIDVSANLLVTPPTGFEASLDNLTFSKTVSIVTTTSSIPSTQVYFRLAAATPVGTYNGNVIITTTDVPTATIVMPDGTVTPAPLTITADNKERIIGKPDPVFTATYTGFVNSETAAQLVTLPVFTTTATATSPEGKYPITPGGAVSPNYDFTYVDGVLTIKRTANIFVPNTFSPNGDGVNDTWLIKDLDNYPNCTVSVFNRTGQGLFFLSSYARPWDGTYNGKNLPTGVYYYVIRLTNVDKPISGYVTIIR